MKLPIKIAALLVLMLTTAAIAVAIKPIRVLPNASERMDYELVIPQQFGSWRALPANSGGIVNPQTEAKLAQLYSQIVSRTYVDTLTGKSVMLSVAYGEEQNKQSQVHLPEVCYPAQGFQIAKGSNDTLQTSAGAIPIKRIVATAGTRTEPITYWIRLGNSVVRGSYEQKIMTVKQGLVGEVTDGLLFRVSSIDSDTAQAYQIQDKFAQELVNATQPQFRHLLIGKKLANR